MGAKSNPAIGGSPHRLAEVLSPREEVGVAPEEFEAARRAVVGLEADESTASAVLVQRLRAAVQADDAVDFRVEPIEERFVEAMRCAVPPPQVDRPAVGHPEARHDSADECRVPVIELDVPDVTSMAEAREAPSRTAWSAI